MTSLAHNVRHFRKLRGMTQGELANRIGISRNAFRAIETGQSAPRPQNLVRLAEGLGVSPLELVREVPKLQSLRFRCRRRLTAQQKAEKAQVVAEAATWMRDFKELEILVNDERPYVLSELRRRGRSPAKMAHEVRSQFGLDNAQPVDAICDVLEREGIKVYLFESALEQIFGFSVAEHDGGPVIGVNVRSDISVERRIFTVAHELGHLVLHKSSYGQDELAEDVDHEQEADVFASHFLLPPAGFDRVWTESRGLHFVERVMKAKRHFQVSYLSVLKRLVDLGTVDESVWPRFRVEYQQRYGRRLAARMEPFPADAERFAGRSAGRAEPLPLAEEDFGEERLNRLVRFAVEAERISVSRGAEILRISASEMRELMDSWEIAA